MTALQVITIAFLIPSFVQIVCVILSKEKYRQKNVVQMPRLFLPLGLTLGILAGSISIICLFTTQTYVWYLIAVGLGLLSCLFLIIYNSLRITYDKNGFRVRRLFGHEKLYGYDAIDRVVMGSGSSYTLYLKNGKILVDSLAVGGEAFLIYADSRYSKTGLGACIPHSQSKLFHGYVLNPLEFVIIFVIVAVFMVGGAVFVTCVSVENLKMPNTAEYQDVRFEMGSEDNEWFVLKTREGNMRIALSVVSDTHALQMDIENGRAFDVAIEPWQLVNHVPTTYIWDLRSDNGTEFVSAERVFADRRSNAVEAIMVIWSIVILYLLLAVWACHILNHAPEHPRLAALLVKKEYRNF